MTTRLLAAHARDHRPGACHPSVANLVQGTVYKILSAHDVKPQKVRYTRSGKIPSSRRKWQRCCAFPARARWAGRRAARTTAAVAVAVAFYDQKPAIQAIGTTALDVPLVPGSHPTIGKKHGTTVTPMAGIDLLRGQGAWRLARTESRRRLSAHGCGGTAGPRGSIKKSDRFPVGCPRRPRCPATSLP